MLLNTWVNLSKLQPATENLSKLQPVTEHLEQPSTATMSGPLNIRIRDFAHPPPHTLHELCLSLDFGLPDGGINLPYLFPKRQNPVCYFSQEHMKSEALSWKLWLLKAAGRLIPAS